VSGIRTWDPSVMSRGRQDESAQYFSSDWLVLNEQTFCSEGRHEAHSIL